MHVALPILLAACSKDGPPEGVPVESIRGDLTWSFRFDDATHAAGVDDCSYTRRYDGLTDVSVPWLCPDCESLWQADVTLDGRSTDCFERLFAYTPADTEWLGYDGQEVRRGTENFLLGTLGDSAWDGDELPVDYSVEYTPADLPIVGVPEDSTFTMAIEGDLKRDDADGDPWHGWEPPETYACGWPRADEPAYEGDWVLQPGKTLPDGWFRDTCGDSVRLHHLGGRYLVIDVSAADCGPCQDMASQAAAFHADLETAGVDVMTVTLLAPTLSAVLDPTPRKTLRSWGDVFDLDDPVLGDRGWGVWVAGQAVGDAFGYPTWIVVAPDLRVLEVVSGWPGSWQPIEDTILRDAGLR